ncbi:MAG: c-type cytochrome [Chloroflexi bacterium]|nr:c-type cytochrome [Chloroflexota bacterium]
MFGNIVAIAILVAIVVGLALLTRRAWRAKRGAWLKWGGAILAGLLTLVFALVVFVAGKGLAAMYIPTSEPAPNLKVEGTPEQVARGKYIAYIGCAGCHGTKEEFPLAGGFDLAADIPMPIGSLVSANLTPGGVLKDRTDGELFRAIRHGYGKDGTVLALMSLMPYRQLSDDDTKALIAFLRSQPATQTQTLGGDNINLLGAILVGAGMFPAPDPVNKNPITAPAKGVNPEYGKYVATFGECRGCHGPNLTGTPASAAGDAIPDPRPIVSTWSRDQFVQTMRSGVKPTGQAFPQGMPWKNASRMDDTDLAALYEYIRSLAGK